MGSARTPGREQFLLDRTMEHDSPGLLFTVASNRSSPSDVRHSRRMTP
jgi:hypothetical protein